jgi:N-acetylglucosaminyl-diphospho-decaprenol L-rhamnosyltransferase
MFETATALAPTVYIPTVNGGEQLRNCLDSLQRQSTRADVVVADNGSGAGSASMLADEFPDVTRIGFDRNLGFGKALNRAIAEEGEGPIVLLNDDVVADIRFIERLQREASDAEMVAGVLLSEPDPTRIDSAGVIVDQTLMAFDYLSGAPVESLDSAPAPLGPTGGAALYCREAFEAVGGFDERIFVYYEDVDLALRLRRAGATCALARDARAVHRYSATLGANSGRKYAMTGWGRGYLLRRYGVMTSPGVAAQALCREVVVCAGQIADHHTAAGVRGRIRGWRDAGGLPTRPMPMPELTRLSITRALAMRRKRAAT